MSMARQICQQPRECLLADLSSALEGSHLPLDAALELGVFSSDARGLAEVFWPGPLTLVVPRAAKCPVSLLCSAGLQSLALRVPSHPLALALIAAAGVPIAAPSANLSGRLSPTTAAL